MNVVTRRAAKSKTAETYVTERDEARDNIQQKIDGLARALASLGAARLVMEAAGRSVTELLRTAEYMADELDYWCKEYSQLSFELHAAVSP